MPIEVQVVSDQDYDDWLESAKKTSCGRSRRTRSHRLATAAQ